MVEAGDLTAQAGRPLIIKAYQAVIDNYPKSKWAGHAQQRLESLNKDAVLSTF
jgi:outer membrane protein assembly factor BamD (BamD/ComL family)